VFVLLSFVGWVKLLNDSERIVTQHQRFKTLSAGLLGYALFSIEKSS
jgi:hypothetical protein